MTQAATLRSFPYVGDGGSDWLLRLWRLLFGERMYVLLVTLRKIEGEETDDTPR